MVEHAAADGDIPLRGTERNSKCQDSFQKQCLMLAVFVTRAKYAPLGRSIASGRQPMRGVFPRSRVSTTPAY